VTTSETVIFLGHVLYELGLIDAEELSVSLAEVATQKRLHGQVLLGRGKVSRQALIDGLREQRARKVHHAFSLSPARCSPSMPARTS
jgi:hypothetical protein